MKKKLWVWISGGVLGLTLVIAVISLIIIHSGTGARPIMSRSGVFSVSDLKTQASLQNQTVTVAGEVAPGSVRQDGMNVSFSITDSRDTLDITFQGKLPNNFKPGASVELSGIYRTDGTLEAQSFNRPASICVICHG